MGPDAIERDGERNNLEERVTIIEKQMILIFDALLFDKIVIIRYIY
jgi:hypothetical protein